MARNKAKKKKARDENMIISGNDRCISDFAGMRQGASLLVYLFRFSISATEASTIELSDGVFSNISKRI